MKKLLLVSALACATLASATVKFPYPQNHTYSYATNISDIWNCAGQDASSMLLSAFQTYMSKYYEESGDQARIKFDESQYTVSEGIGYGMILCVYFSNNTTSYQSQFDKLWNYYQNHVNGNGLMNWKIQGFSGTIGSNGATDAEEDVAFALAMAYYQFGDSKYQTAAASLIAKIRQYEFSSNGMHKLGDAWDNYKNPSYVSPAAYEIFKIFDSSNSSFWASAITTNYELLTKNRNSSTGLPSGWADNSSYSPIVGNNGYNFAGYDYDAVRAPWRWAWSYAWYGHSQAKDLSEKLATWVNNTSFGKLYINMTTDGNANLTGEPCTTNGCKANGSSIGSLSSVLIVSDSYHDKLNENYSALLSQQDGYFHSNLRLLTGLLMTGNFPNMAVDTPVEPKTFTIPDGACVDTTTVYVNSGAYGWHSTSVELSQESNTGVYMGKLIQGEKREAFRAVDGVEAGKTYTLSFDATQTDGSNLWLTYGVYTDSTQENKLCGAMKKLSAGTAVNYTCEFTATSTPVYFTLILNNWDDPQVLISNLALTDGSGAAVIIPEEEVPADTTNIATGAIEKQALKLSVADRIAYIQLAYKAQIAVMDMQGRSVIPARNAEAGLAQVSLEKLNAGNYLVVVKQAGARMSVLPVHIAE